MSEKMKNLQNSGRSGDELGKPLSIARTVPGVVAEEQKSEIVRMLEGVRRKPLKESLSWEIEIDGQN